MRERLSLPFPVRGVFREGGGNHQVSKREREREREHNKRVGRPPRVGTARVRVTNKVKSPLVFFRLLSRHSRFSFLLSPPRPPPPPLSAKCSRPYCPEREAEEGVWRKRGWSLLVPGRGGQERALESARPRRADPGAPSLSLHSPPSLLPCHATQTRPRTDEQGAQGDREPVKSGAPLATISARKARTHTHTHPISIFRTSRRNPPSTRPPSRPASRTSGLNSSPSSPPSTRRSSWRTRSPSRRAPRR